MQKLLQIFTLFSLLVAVVFLSVSLSGCNVFNQAGNQDPEHPNIILIMTDDQPMHTLNHMPVV